MREVLLYTIYDRTTSDYPGEFVCRRFDSRTGQPFDLGAPFLRAGTLDEIRRQLPPDLFNLGRHGGDDPVIVEVWV